MNLLARIEALEGAFAEPANSPAWIRIRLVTARRGAVQADPETAIALRCDGREVVRRKGEAMNDLCARTVALTAPRTHGSVAILSPIF